MLFQSIALVYYIIMDQDSTLMTMLMNYLFKRLNIKIKTVAPYNHQSIHVEHGIKSEAAKNYSITEVEMCGLAINIVSFAH